MPSADWRYQTPEWRRLRRLVLDRDHVCQMQLPGCTKWATAVDHVVPVADGGAFFDLCNLRGACRGCNSRGGASIANRTRRFGYSTGVPDYETRF